MNIQIAEGILIPFLGTSLGAAMVFFLKKQISGVLQKALTGFAAGVMVAASFWSLLQPALESSSAMGSLAFLPASVGFLVGIGFLLLLDILIPHMHMDKQNEGPKSGFRRTTKLILAVTLHNIPEGMAVGVVYAGLLAGSSGITAAGALTLALGIAIQNFPEGAIVSMPLLAEGMPKQKTFWMGVLSGVVEPVAAVITMLAAGLVTPVMPYFLAFAAGAMMYVVVEELIPEMSEGKHSNVGTIAFSLGFVVMMILDVTLGYNSQAFRAVPFFQHLYQIFIALFQAVEGRLPVAVVLLHQRIFRGSVPVEEFHDPGKIQVPGAYGCHPDIRSGHRVILQMDAVQPLCVFLQPGIQIHAAVLQPVCVCGNAHQIRRHHSQQMLHQRPPVRHMGKFKCVVVIHHFKPSRPKALCRRPEILREAQWTVRHMVSFRQIAEPDIPAAVQQMPPDQFLRAVQKIFFRIVRQNNTQSVPVAQGLDLFRSNRADCRQLNRPVADPGDLFQRLSEIRFVPAVFTHRIALGSDFHAAQ